MRPAATRPDGAMVPTLYLAFELGNTEWKLGLTAAVDRPVLMRTVAARDLAALEREIARAKVHFGLPPSAAVKSCYEAGRDGFWLHRWLMSRGIANWIVDLLEHRSESPATTDEDRSPRCDEAGVDAHPRAWRRAEGVERRQRADTSRRGSPPRAPRAGVARRDRGRHINGIKGLLASQGVPLEHIQDMPAHVVSARLWDGWHRVAAPPSASRPRMGDAASASRAHSHPEARAAGVAARDG